jgi:hypothetical protein
MITRFTSALFNDILIIKRVMSQSMRDHWPGVNQPYQPKEDRGN